MAPAEWQRRDKVVVRLAGKRPTFFLEARTNEYWWFRVEFRTEKGLFDQADLAQKLKLKSWDEIPERQVYGGMAATDPAGAGGAADL